MIDTASQAPWPRRRAPGDGGGARHPSGGCRSARPPAGMGPDADASEAPTRLNPACAARFSFELGTAPEIEAVTRAASALSHQWPGHWSVATSFRPGGRRLQTAGSATACWLGSSHPNSRMVRHSQDSTWICNKKNMLGYSTQGLYRQMPA